MAIQFKIYTNRNGDQIAVHIHPEMVKLFQSLQGYKKMMLQGTPKKFRFGVRKGCRANLDGQWLAWLREAERRYPNLEFIKIGFWWYEVRMKSVYANL